MWGRLPQLLNAIHEARVILGLRKNTENDKTTFDPLRSSQPRLAKLHVGVDFSQWTWVDLQNGQQSPQLLTSSRLQTTRTDLLFCHRTEEHRNRSWFRTRLPEGLSPRGSPTS